MSATEVPDTALAGQALATTSFAVLIADTTPRILWTNPAFTRITGWRLDEAVGRNPNILQSGRHDADFYRALWRALARDGRWAGEVWNRRKCGEIYPEWMRIDAIRDDSGRAVGYIAVFADISLRKERERRLARMAHSDPLTGLPNRALFDDRLGQALALASRNPVRLAIHLLDLDGFKAVNDAHGHAAGDALLKCLGARVGTNLRKSDTLARLGGDEFAVLQPGIGGPLDAERLAARILDSLAEPFAVDGHRLRVGASIGISLYPEHGDEPAGLLAEADRALYAVKNAGKNAYRLAARAARAA